MEFKIIIEPILLQLAHALNEISENSYCQKSILLNGSSIGAHTRHVIELFQCLLNGYESSVINYDKRERSLSIEQDKNIAINLLKATANKISLPNKDLILQGFYCEDNEIEESEVKTNYFRELIYNLEHSIHHMALIRIGIKELSNINLPENFGVAPSTIQYKKLCAQ
jgi:hypothetical protein